LSKRRVVEPWNGKWNTKNTKNPKKREEEEITVSARTSGQKRYIIEVQNNDITLCTGPAGTGKTVIAVGIGLQHIMAASSEYERMIIMRPVKEACDEHIGYLPGDLDEKMIPWAAPVVDNMACFMDKSRIKHLFYEKKIEVLPLAYARGRSLNKAFIIVDEAQNCSPKQMLMVLTRIGEGSKMVINGDLDQSDAMHLVNGLEDAMKRLDGLHGLGITRLDREDIVRHPMIREILRRYQDGAEEETPVSATQCILQEMT